MKSIKKVFSDKEGNHLLVALNFYDIEYKEHILQIPPEYTEIDIVDIAMEKVYIDLPIHFSVFFRVASWIFEVFEKENAIFSYTCSIEELEAKHTIPSQLYRKNLFDALLIRQLKKT